MGPLPTVAGAAILLAASRIGLRWMPLPRLSVLLRRLTFPPRIRPERVAWCVRAASRLVPGTTCLTQAIAVSAMLPTARVRIGFARDGGGRIESHAWVEHEGRILIGGPDVSRFVPLGA